MTDIEVTVRVPGDLEVASGSSPDVAHIWSGASLVRFLVASNDWDARVWQQIAAAIEARKPRPPKFQVGDIVEWTTGTQGQAGMIDRCESGPQGFLYWLNGIKGHAVAENRLTLVRRAAK